MPSTGAINVKEEDTSEEQLCYGNTTITGDGSAILGNVTYTTHHHYYSASVPTSSTALDVTSSANPASAFVVARSLLQFIDSGTSLVSLVWQLYQHGFDICTPQPAAVFSKSAIKGSLALQELEDGSNEYAQLRHHMSVLHLSLADLQLEASRQATSLAYLAVACCEAFPQLLSVFDRAIATELRRKKETTSATFRQSCNEDELKFLQNNMSFSQEQLNSRILHALR